MMKSFEKSKDTISKPIELKDIPIETLKFEYEFKGTEFTEDPGSPNTYFGFKYLCYFTEEGCLFVNPFTKIKKNISLEIPRNREIDMVRKARVEEEKAEILAQVRRACFTSINSVTICLSEEELIVLSDSLFDEKNMTFKIVKINVEQEKVIPLFDLTIPRCFSLAQNSAMSYRSYALSLSPCKEYLSLIILVTYRIYSISIINLNNKTNKTITKPKFYKEFDHLYDEKTPVKEFYDDRCASHPVLLANNKIAILSCLENSPIHVYDFDLDQKKPFSNLKLLFNNKDIRFFCVSDNGKKWLTQSSDGLILWEIDNNYQAKPVVNIQVQPIHGRYSTLSYLQGYFFCQITEGIIRINEENHSCQLFKSKEPRIFEPWFDGFICNYNGDDSSSYLINRLIVPSQEFLTELQSVFIGFVPNAKDPLSIILGYAGARPHLFFAKKSSEDITTSSPTTKQVPRLTG